MEECLGEHQIIAQKEGGWVVQSDSLCFKAVEELYGEGDCISVEEDG